MLTAFLLLCACMVIMLAATFILPGKIKVEAQPLVWENWIEPLRVKCGRGLSDYRVVSAVVLVIFATLYVVFR
jgi:hypothetical protein